MTIPVRRQMTVVHSATVCYPLFFFKRGVLCRDVSCLCRSRQRFCRVSTGLGGVGGGRGVYTIVCVTILLGVACDKMMKLRWCFYCGMPCRVTFFCCAPVHIHGAFFFYIVESRVKRKRPELSHY